MDKVHIKLYLILIFIFSLAVSMPIQAATIMATVDRNPVSLDESFRLILSIKGKLSGEPDLIGLKNDFDILATSQSTNVQIINGSMSRQAQFFITLMPKREGKLIIPAITIGDDRSQKITLTVVKPSISSQNNTDISLDVSVNTRKLMLQEQLIVSVRLTIAVNLVNASLSTLQVSGSDAIIERLGEDSEFETLREGVRVKVIERRYAVFPQQSGVLTIDPVIFNGQILQVSSRIQNNSLFRNSRDVRNKRLSSKPLKINVSAIPASQMKKPWLPATKMRLTEAWQESPPVFKVGEAITRTLTLTAEGLMAAQLPEIKITMPSEFKHYSDQAMRNEEMRNTGVVSVRQQKIAIIPSKEGAYFFPEINLDWWSTKNNRSETLRIPAREVHVLAADILSALNGNISVEIGPDVINKSENSFPLGLGFKAFFVASSYWVWISLGLMVGWITTFFIMTRQRKTLLNMSHQQDEISEEANYSKKEALKIIKKFCLNNDPTATKGALLVWAALYFREQSMRSLADIAKGCNEVIGVELNGLNHVLYSDKKSNWDGQKLWKAMELYCKNNNNTFNDKIKKRSLLEPLYP